VPFGEWRNEITRAPVLTGGSQPIIIVQTAALPIPPTPIPPTAVPTDAPAPVVIAPASADPPASEPIIVYVPVPIEVIPTDALTPEAHEVKPGIEHGTRPSQRGPNTAGPGMPEATPQP